MRYSVWVLVLTGLLIYGHARADETGKTHPPLDEWAATSPAIHQSFSEKIGVRTADVLFDLIDDLSASQNIGDLRLSLSVHRKVFDNHDILNSWTVADRFSVGGWYNLFSLDSGPFGFNIGTLAGIDILDIHQVLPADYSKLPSAEERKAEMEKEPWFDDFKKNRGKTSELTWNVSTNEQNEKEVSFFRRTPENNARFSKQLNRLTHPFHLPMSTKSLAKMEDGEIMSYNTSFGGRVGASVGWNVDLIGLAGRAAFDFTTILKGDARISVLKEDSRFAKVKRTLVASLVAGPGANAQSDISAVDGMIVVKDIAKHLRIIPFNLRINREWAKAFDVGYRYDLENPNAVEAYNAAVLNNFTLSDLLSVDENGNTRDAKLTGVEKIFTRNSFATTKSVAQKFKITFAYIRNQKTSLQQMEATITLPDGTHHVFSSLVENSREWKTIWGSFEKLKYDFSATLNMTRYEKEPEATDNFILSADGSIEDSSASYKELMSYILEAENALNKPGLFPRPPDDMIYRSLKKSSSKGDEDISKVDIGRARFYYRLTLNRPQIEKFIHTPPTDMWPMIEKVFGADPGSWSNPVGRRLREGTRGALLAVTFPLYFFGAPLRESTGVFHATMIHDHWEKIQKQESVVDKLRALGELFYDRYYSYELIRLLRLRLDGDEVDYVVTADSPAFGHIWKQGRTELQFENIATKLQQEVDFDLQKGHLPELTRESELLDVSSELLDYRTPKLKIHFRVNQPPKAIFLQVAIHEVSPYRPETIEPLGNVLFVNDDTIVAGENSFVLDPSDTKSAFYSLAKKLAPGKHYTFRLAANGNGVAWGRTVDLDVRTPIPR